MSWCNCNNHISYDNNCLIEIIDFFVLHCPVSIRSRVTDGTWPDGKKKKKTIYKDVSVRECSFHKNGVSGSLLSTILAEIRRPLAKQDLFQIIKSDGDVVSTVESLINNRTCSDQWSDLLIIQTRSEMPDSEAIYYYIRNAFAHGSFEILVDDKNRIIYRLECQKDGVVKAQMQLKESTLLRLKALAKKSPQEIKKLQRHKK